MFRHRATRLGSLCVRLSVDPGSRGARRARRTLCRLKASYRAWWLYLLARVGMSGPVCSWGRLSYLGAPTGSYLMAVIRTELEQSLHRLANFVECELATILPALLAESRVEATWFR